MAEFCMPSLGTDMAARTLVEWCVQPGDHVKRGDIIAVVETEKGIIDIEVFETGVVEQLLIQLGTQVPVGTVLATISAGGEPTAAVAGVLAAMPAPAPEAAEPQGRPRRAVPRPQAHAPVPQAPAPAPGRRVRISPLARKLATELAIDLGTVHGTGPEGTIQRADVERAAAARQAAPPAPVPPAAAAVPPAAVALQAGMRRAIAAAIARSNREIPHYYVQTRIDMGVSHLLHIAL